VAVEPSGIMEVSLRSTRLAALTVLLWLATSIAYKTRLPTDSATESADSFAMAAVCAQQGPDVPNFPTPPASVEAMLRLAKVTKDDVVYDLGCGDGRIVVAAAKEFGARGVGVDIDPKCVRESEENARKAGVAARARFYLGDLFKTDISYATVVALYLSPELNRRLIPKLLKELRPGTRVVAHVYDMGDWTPDKTVDAPGSTKYKLFLWTIPAQVGGTWRWTGSSASGAQSDSLNFTQAYQSVRGAVGFGGHVHEITVGSVRGDAVSVRALMGIGTGKLWLDGTVHGGVLSGTIAVLGPLGDTTIPFTARRESVR
jgi:SAM-dependent methyltransferase